jgi:hypothetical protein
MIEAVRKLLNRKQAYRRVFIGADGKVGRDAEIVLADLRRFCRANSSTVVISPISKTIDPYAMALAEGRREVWNRLMSQLYLDEKTVQQLSEDD